MESQNRAEVVLIARAKNKHACNGSKGLFVTMAPTHTHPW